MQKVVFIIVLNLILSVAVFSQNTKQKFFVNNNETTIEATVDTVLEKLRIVTTEDVDRLLVWGDKVLQKYEYLHVTFKKKYDFKNSTVVIISTNPGGSGTFSSYYIVELFKDKKSLISKELYSDVDTFKIEKDTNGKIVIDMGFDSGLHKYAVYENSKLSILKKKVEKSPAKEEDCNFLYHEIYRAFIEQHMCDSDPHEVSGMASVRAVNGLINDPRLDIDRLSKISKKACKSLKPIEYAEFKTLICNSNSK